MPYVENLEEFDQRMGCEKVYLPNQNRWIYSNGAQSDGNWHQEPPTDPRRLHALKIDFLNAKLRKVRGKYRQDRTAIAAQIEFYDSGAGPAPSKGWEDHLKKLRREIHELESELNRIRFDNPQFTRFFERQEEVTARKQKANQMTSDLRKICGE